MADETATATEDQQQRTFSHDEVERIVADRVRNKLTKISEERDQAKAALEQANQRVAQFEQLERRVETLTQERDQAVEQVKTAQEGSLNARLRAEVTTAAVKARAVDPDDVFRLLPDEAVTVNAESGSIEGVDAAVNALAESKPHLFGKPAKPGPSDGGARSDQGKGEPQQPVDMNDLLRRSAGRSA